ncbi:MAG: hypothetical protein FH751_14525 [Firmicutes bacterium]|nr:hypothetical protein [Bacillota bacterium]
MSEEHQLTEIQEIACSCIDRWGEDINTQNFSGKLGRFVSQLGDDKDLGRIFLELVKSYNYYSRESVDKLLKEFYNKIISELKLKKQYTIYSRIEDDSKIDSSNNFLSEFKIINDISNHFSHDIEKLSINDFDEIENIIFLDDIIGTGKTVKKFFEKNLEKVRQVKCYIFCIEILGEGKEFLEDYFEKNEIECKIIYHNLHHKVFKKDHIFSDNHKKKEELLRELEKEIWGKKSNFILGYNNSQAIVTFFRNTPNNTLSSFWYNRENWQGLFPRNDELPAFKKRKRNNVRYNIKKKGEFSK